ncbi:hypothetical protein KIPB_005328 [Kipferlia bialata]|nr:hypothetical protein KIPB_005328 [Kipferlia bialata]|eukprot:g5328.t1
MLTCYQDLLAQSVHTLQQFTQSPDLMRHVRHMSDSVKAEIDEVEKYTFVDYNGCTLPPDVVLPDRVTYLEEWAARSFDPLSLRPGHLVVANLVNNHTAQYTAECVPPEFKIACRKLNAQKKPRPKRSGDDDIVTLMYGTEPDQTQFTLCVVKDVTFPGADPEDIEVLSHAEFPDYDSHLYACDDNSSDSESGSESEGEGESDKKAKKRGKKKEYTAQDAESLLSGDKRLIPSVSLTANQLRDLRPVFSTENAKELSVRERLELAHRMTIAELDYAHHDGTNYAFGPDASVDAYQGVRSAADLTAAVQEASLPEVEFKGPVPCSVGCRPKLTDAEYSSVFPPAPSVSMETHFLETQQHLPSVVKYWDVIPLFDPVDDRLVVRVPKNSKCLAFWPETTCFYTGTVLEEPTRANRFHYRIAFDAGMGDAVGNDPTAKLVLSVYAKWVVPKFMSFSKFKDKLKGCPNKIKEFRNEINTFFGVEVKPPVASNNKLAIHAKGGKGSKSSKSSKKTPASSKSRLKRKGGAVHSPFPAKRKNQYG